ncbi:MAG: ATP-dependent DNA ligase [Verrucomicrobiales bacterium]
MDLPIKIPFPPMEALSVDEIPEGHEWQYEPKWDGFRCLCFKDGEEVFLQSKAGQPLGRYFPELIDRLSKLKASRFVLDSEIVVPVDHALSFDELLLRLHPAESRVRKLAAAHPAELIVFDLLVDEHGKSLAELPLRERRVALEKFAKKYFVPGVRLSPATRDIVQARKWFGSPGETLDGIMAKLVELPYQSGERTGMQKIKQHVTIDCVVGGFRYAAKKPVVGSLLLGLYDDQGILHHVGFCSGIKAKEKPAVTKKLEALRGGTGFTGRSPGGPSRWSTERSGEWEALKPELVVEVSYDHFTGGRFRHGTKFIRWRPEKDPRQCDMDQIKRGSGLNLWQSTVV